jgi:hypothetical protein
MVAAGDGRQWGRYCGADDRQHHARRVGRIAAAASTLRIDLNKRSCCPELSRCFRDPRFRARAQDQLQLQRLLSVTIMPHVEESIQIPRDFEGETLTPSIEYYSSSNAMKVLGKPAMTASGQTVPA